MDTVDYSVITYGGFYKHDMTHGNGPNVNWWSDGYPSSERMRMFIMQPEETHQYTIWQERPPYEKDLTSQNWIDKHYVKIAGPFPTLEAAMAAYRIARSTQ